MFQASQHFRSSETQAVCDSTVLAFPASLSARSFPFTPACSGQHIHGFFRKWMTNIDICQSGLPVPLFTLEHGTKDGIGHILQDTNGTGSQKAHYQRLIFGNALPSSKVRSRRNKSDQITGRGTVGMKRIEKIWVGKNKKCRVLGSG